MKILDDDVEIALEDASEMDANEAALRALDSEITSLQGGYWVVTKVIGSKSDPRGYCFRDDASALPTLDDLRDRVRREYGPGEYQCHLKQKNRIVKNLFITIAEAVMLKPEAVKPPGSEASTAINAAIAPVMELVRSTAAEAAELRKAMITGSRSSINDMVLMMGAMGTMMKALNPARNSGDPIESMERMLKLKRTIDAEFGDGSDPEPEWWERAIDKAAPLVMGAVNAFGAARAGTILPAPDSAQNTTGAVAMNPVDQIIIGVLRPYAGLLQTVNNGAENGGDPETYADILLDQLPESVVFMGQTVELSDSLIRQGLTRPDALDTFMRVYPPARPHREWYGKLITAVLALLDESEHPDGGDTA